MIRSILNNFFGFLAYYSKLRRDVWRGRHETKHPLGLKWRWRLWRHRKWSLKA